MKHSTWLVLFIALVTTTTPAIAGLGPSSTSGPVDAGHQDAEEIHVPEDCTPHPPILIEQDVGPLGFEWEDPATGERAFRPGSGVVAGSGTSEDPYVIEGWCIVGEPSLRGIVSRSTTQAGVSLKGTSAHVLVRDNVILGSSSSDSGPTVNPAGISFQGATNARADENLIDGFWYGISVRSDNGDAVLHGNTIKNSSWAGIRLIESSGVTLTENTMDRGLSFGVSSANYDDIPPRYYLHDIDGSNTVNGGPLWYAAYVEGTTAPPGAGQVIVIASEDVRLGGLTMDQPTKNLIVFSENVTIADSEFTQAEVILLRSNESRIQSNVFALNPSSDLALRSDGTQGGISLMGSNGNAITGNTLDGSGVSLHSSNGNTLAGNTIAGALSRFGAFNLWSGSHNTIQGNTVTDNPQSGIFLGPGALENTVRDNAVTNSSTPDGDDCLCAGIEVWGRETTLHNNTIAGNELGILVTSYAPRVTIENNTIADNRHYGVAMSALDSILRDNVILGNGKHGVVNRVGLSGGGENTTIQGNTIAHNAWNGIRLALTSQFYILDNVVHDNGRSGVSILDSDESVVRGNTIQRNGEDGLRLHSFSADQTAVTMVEGEVRGENEWWCIRGAALVDENPYDFHTGCGSSLHTVEHNNVTGNARHGVSVDHSFGDRINRNNIWDNGGHGVFANNTQLVHALHNWWGCEQGPTGSPCDSVEGPVHHDPWLKERHPDAGAG